MKRSKRPILLLEVLIAFALVALCIFPLISPHVFMLKAQYQFNAQIALDQAIGKIYVSLLEKIYRNEIPWSAFEQKEIFAIDEHLKKAAGIDKLANKGTYQFAIRRKKGGKEQPFSAHVITVVITFEKSGPPVSGPEQKSTYTYEFFAAHLHNQQDEKEEK